MDTTIKNTPRRPLFPFDPVPENFASNVTTKSKSTLLLASRIISTLRLNWKTISSACIVALLGLLWYYPTFFLIFIFLCYTIVLVTLSVCATAYIHYICTCDPPSQHPQTLNTLDNVTKSRMFDLPEPIQNVSNLPLIFGKSVDLQLQQILEYVSRDFMSSWLGYVVTKPRLINDIVREDLWHAIEKVHERAKKIDAAKIIAVEMLNRVTVHLEKIRITEARLNETGHVSTFSTHTYLNDEETELTFLRKLSEIIIIVLLPRGYSLSPLKMLLSEIVSFKILFPLIKMLTSPDYINQKIVQNIETRLAAVAMNKRSYEYAASFEDFLKIINNSGNLEELSLIRKSIVNDLMHATSMQNIQRAKGLDPDNDDNNLLSKSDLSAAIRLKRYVKQLTLAKNQCEKNLSKFGWNGNYSSDIDLTLQEILLTDVGRRFLTIFLDQMKASALVGFYVAVEELKRAPASNWHQLGTEIFYNYIRVPKPEIVIEKHERKLFEGFMLGDAGLEVFFDVQKNVLKTLEQHYYAPFVLSEQYRQLKEVLNSNDFLNNSGIMLQALHDSQDEHSVGALNESNGSADTINVVAHSSYARRRLEQLQERIDKKSQALDALKHSVRPESKVLQVLEKEMDWLKSEKRQTESHLRRTDAWTDHLGKWKATIQSVEMSDEKESLQLMILVHVDEDINVPMKNNANDSNTKISNITTRPGSISSGWAVMRSLNQVHELHRKLRHVNSYLKSMDLPTNFKFYFLKNDKNALEKAKLQIQKFLNFILEDDHLNASEAIYTFLSPSSDHLKQPLPSPKKNKFSLATLFKGDGAKSQDINKAISDPFWGMHRDEEHLTTFLEGGELGNESKFVIGDSENKDSIAEPLYALLGEIFDTGGLFKWVRKSLISFVQMTYGSTINRQIRVSINYLFEESMLHYYFSAILKSFWPGGVLASSYPARSDDMKEMTTNAAKALLVDNVPEVLCNLVGAQAAKQGVVKVFNALQNPIYNKQLFYDFLEIVMLELFPEIRQMKVLDNNNVNKNKTSNSTASTSAATTNTQTSTPTNINQPNVQTNATVGGILKSEEKPILIAGSQTFGGAIAPI